MVAPRVECSTLIKILMNSSQHETLSPKALFIFFFIDKFTDQQKRCCYGVNKCTRVSFHGIFSYFYFFPLLLSEDFLIFTRAPEILG